MKRFLPHVPPLLLIALVTFGLAWLAAGVSGHETVAVGTEADRIYLGDGFYDPEQSAEQGTYRWTKPLAQMVLPDWGPGNVHVSISGAGGGTAPTEAVLSIAGVPVNTAPVEPGKPWTVQAWGISSSRSPTVTLGGPPTTAPGDARALGRLVKQIDIYAPDARNRAWANLALLALSAVLLYVCIWLWSERLWLATVCGAALLALFGPLVVYRDRWMDTVVWTAPALLGGLLLAQWRFPRLALSRLNKRWSTLAALISLSSVLFLLVLGFFNAFDSERMYQVSAGLAEYGVPTRYPGHETWTKYGFGQPLIAVPFYYLGKLGTLFGGDYAGLTRFTVSLTNLMVIALTCWLLYRASRRFASPGVSLAVGATYLLATPALDYGRTFFSEPAGALLLLTATLLILPRQEENAPTPLRLLGAGFCLGAMILFKPAFAIHIIPAGLAVLWLAITSGMASRRGWEWLKRAFVACAVFAIGPLLGGIVQLGYNYLRYQGLPNSLFRTGYEKEPGFSTPLLEGLNGILFSPGKSLFLYAPVLVLAPVGLWLMFRRGTLVGRMAAILIITQSAYSIVFNALWWAWTGNFAWGPRLVMTVLPLLVWPLAPFGNFVTRLREKAVRWRVSISVRGLLLGLWIALAGLGAVVSIPGALTDFQVYYHLHGLYLAEDADAGPTIYDLRESPLVVQPHYLLDGLTVAIYRPSLSDLGMPGAWDVVVPGALVLFTVSGAWLAIRPAVVASEIILR